MRKLIGAAAIALLATACGTEGSPGQASDESRAQGSSIEDCEMAEAFDIDFAAEAEQPTAEDALEAFLDDPPSGISVPSGEPQLAEAEGRRARWTLIDEHGDEVGELHAEQRSSGGWTVVGGQVCAAGDPSRPLAAGRAVSTSG